MSRPLQRAHSSRAICLPLSLLALVLVNPSIAADKAASRAEIEFFERKIRPVLVEHCYECHSEKSDDLGGDLLLDSRMGSRVGGESGPAVVPGKPRESLLISALEFRDFEMPPEGKLPENVIRDFRRWIQMGARDPRKGDMPELSEEDETASDLWSLHAITRPDAPETDEPEWSQTTVDRFVRAELSRQNLDPVGAAEPLTLLRRLHFDLVGLPPSPAEIAAFERAVGENREDAISAVVDQLLTSPQFGERWARHWMDVVRYAESAGSSRDVLMPWAWRYRDYVIDAINADVPYNRFVIEQVAGDLLPADSADERQRLQIATGLLAIGSKSLNGGNVQLDVVDDQIDVIGKAILGLTISCARCHDHKFDPIPTADYYALAGIFRSTETLYGGGTGRPKNVADKLKVYLALGENTGDAAQQIQGHQKSITDLTRKQAAAAKKVQQQQKRLPKDWKERLAELEQPGAKPEKKDVAFLKQARAFQAAQNELRAFQLQLKELKEADLPSLEFAVGVRDAKKVADFPIQVRGNRTKNGDIVPRGFLSCVNLNVPATVETSEQSGRLELALWLTQPDHPLTARVAVNRVWHHVFGRGLVATVDNFGVNGTPPTHPELLDWLAHRFVHEHKWSLKSLVRELVLTRTYQLSNEPHSENYAADPDNAYRWRMSRRRLEAEPMRDAMLSASGTLDLDRPYASPVLQVGEGEVGRGINHDPLTAPFAHRSVYLPIIRGIVPEFLKVFDLPEPSNPQGVRDATNVPAQSLYLMNSPFVMERAEGTAARVIAEHAEDERRLDLAWLICLGRHPTGSEISRSLAFLDRASDRLSPQHSDPEEREHMTWTILTQALFASAEFRFLD